MTFACLFRFFKITTNEEGNPTRTFLQAIVVIEQVAIKVAGN